MFEGEGTCGVEASGETWMLMAVLALRVTVPPVLDCTLLLTLRPNRYSPSIHKKGGSSHIHIALLRTSTVGQAPLPLLTSEYRLPLPEVCSCALTVGRLARVTPRQGLPN